MCNFPNWKKIFEKAINFWLEKGGYEFWVKIHEKNGYFIVSYKDSTWVFKFLLLMTFDGYKKEVYTQWAGRTYEIINIAYVEGFMKSYNFLTVQNLKVAKI